ncbi:sigma-70 family RNA polymerase sigma factor [Aggregicoccus sp. 17bor-14]|uniref:sigma-70 family RNA polymerase sigma factor n=1 Tax=Myxococcaceae TaxID=31 RepID=UPI00129CA17B|nr:MULTISPECIES: sigma-70 family RNA polymerase sigma factor [Myxococcaceae]MBF5043079.1 sigma-70 family RNA polymerase sigma factor [Simulacricoccus sp. 17bor-14]MRI88842.1 sigma-70 family RNA polymerase sigma factor [Aggregicoccus sp. 17bor-14]
MSDAGVEAGFVGAGGQRSPGLAQALSRACAAARAAWPGLPEPEAEFGAHLARHAAGGSAEALAALNVADLYLAWACARGAPAALAALERLLQRAVGHAVKGGVAPADEVRQALLERLLMGSAERAAPRILDYAGQAPLERWLRVAAVRTALNLREARGSVARDAGSDSAELAQRAGPDAELSFLKQHYAREFREAFDAALAALGVDERNVLRLHFLDGLSIDQLGRTYGVHRATAARWVVRGRKALLDETRARLQQRWRMSEPELDSVLRQVRSQLDVTLRWLRSTPAPGGSGD